MKLPPTQPSVLGMDARHSLQQSSYSCLPAIILRVQLAILTNSDIFSSLPTVSEGEFRFACAGSGNLSCWTA
uniref:Uncharacterized protein n=1 Tax=Ascaris lumbricoides TaxID=6252 RepID=A0A0M3HHQ7_ASCLU